MAALHLHKWMMLHFFFRLAVVTASTLEGEGSRLQSPRDPSIEIIPTLGPKDCEFCLHWAIWILKGVFRATEHAYRAFVSGPKNIPITDGTGQANFQPIIFDVLQSYSQFSSLCHHTFG